MRTPWRSGTIRSDADSFETKRADSARERIERLITELEGVLWRLHNSAWDLDPEQAGYVLSMLEDELAHVEKTAPDESTAVWKEGPR